VSINLTLNFININPETDLSLWRLVFYFKPEPNCKFRLEFRDTTSPGWNSGTPTLPAGIPGHHLFRLEYTTSPGWNSGTPPLPAGIPGHHLFRLEFRDTTSSGWNSGTPPLPAGIPGHHLYKQQKLKSKPKFKSI